MNLNEKYVNKLSYRIMNLADNITSSKPEFKAQLSSDLNNCLTTEEKKEFNRGNLSKITPIIVMRGYLDQTGLYELETTKTHEYYFKFEGGMTDEEFQAEIEFYAGYYKEFLNIKK